MGEEVYEQIKSYKKVDWMKLVHQLFLWPELHTQSMEIYVEH